ncbi:gamma-glutamylcyclotransferase [Phyllobacterium sp. 628]|uniref:gamma-glutamylcyclotransferase family protein n=1 Tax=Phyllobacterium sp. 628 TaxID=2718938 RepID=UPI0016623ED9|nr:gamma-glutamylcyclotransferase family protein [Phyllobacterium sp. 628]QND53400.1 gamma-glutamylcyclotransferase [Phyllobacterium sp. 628]
MDISLLAERDDVVAYFGYGSLVNRNTLRTNIIHAIPARLLGWRRLWRPRPDMPGFPAALLSVAREEGASIDGLLVFDHRDNLASVDLREVHYDRRDVHIGHIETDSPLQLSCPVYVYEAQHDVPRHPEPPIILQSYLDAVMQGFLIEHGEAGLRRFVSETRHFDTPILRDRAVPTYPRSVTTSDEERFLFDGLLNERNAVFVEMPEVRQTGVGSQLA